MTENNGAFEETSSGKLKETLLTITEQMKAAGDEKTVIKLEEILDKLRDQFLNIGFCGHFSAGKSTMINRLVGKPLLPASPIPTSANLVQIRFGEPRAVIHMTDGEKLQIDVDQIEQWKSYCKNGQEVERVEIFDSEPLLEGGLQLLDTPGIDSTDDAHQEATEAALHLADIVFFVTDYNHVQSEMNFEFIRTLKEKGKTLVFIINQVDKHREEELSFEGFQSKLKGGLKEWGIQVDAILYASMKHPSHPLNQFEQVNHLFDYMKANKKELIMWHAMANIQAVLKEHEQIIQEQTLEDAQEKVELIVQLKHDLNWEQQSNWFNAYVNSSEAAEAWKTEVRKEAAKLIDNAIITPYVTTQLAQKYIESRQRNFKVGVLFAGKKTEQERKQRLDDLFIDVSNRIESQIEWHVKELLKRAAERLGIQDQKLLIEFMDWKVPFTEQVLSSKVQEGVVSQEYVYTYTKEVVQEIKRLTLVQLEKEIGKGQEYLMQQHAEAYAPYQDQLEQYNHMKKLEDELSKQEEQVQQQIAVLVQRIQKLQATQSKEPDLQTVLQAAQKSMAVSKANERDVQPNIKTGSLEGEQKEGLNETKEIGADSSLGADADAPPIKLGTAVENMSSLNSAKLLEQAAMLLTDTKGILQRISSASTLVRDMEEKAVRLKENRFTVCLFGAFSAGKSSFANALLGEHVLPVSPNPTTAAINQVLPPTEDHPSGTAVIRMKRKEQIEEEIRTALERLQLPVKENMLNSLQSVRTIDPHSLRTSLKPYFTFLTATLKGWQEAEEHLGTEFSVGQEDYSAYVAVEERACFVESIQLYHANAFTAQGIEIIDTPGADSIYSRHTNVTFNYIKHADVIIYVTYYNHAFSRADRQFLDQLGRVKDQFDLDKMFFIVNAADLADSDEELTTVVEHVQDNLLRSGIRFPKIYPASSLRVLQGHRDEGMEEFIRSFYGFVQQDLTQLLLDSAQRDVSYGSKWLHELKRDLNKNQADKEQEMKKLLEQSKEWKLKIGERSYDSYRNELEQEMKEHAHHIKQRLLFKLSEHQQEAFHPSILSGKNVNQQLLLTSLEECMHSILFQLKDELKATSLRMEGFIQKLLQRSYEEGMKNVIQDGIVLSNLTFKVEESGLPMIPEALPAFSEQDKKELLRHFKSGKQFFEGEGRTKLREELEQKVQPVAEQYLDKATTAFISFYHELWQQEEQSYKQKVLKEIDSAVEGKLSVLKGEVKVEELEQIICEYDKVLENRGLLLTAH
ncbi:dynamin family protein [Bacillus horti]|uniref:Small GTP-binding protein n=1 Tax=Caldalkalibacillus horti TaxID=77523 RepID=A0ABT9W4F5_9BACI|nr:dynamin family protein [Bacillus horti]MDQ0168129.1 small GTP-binding protein [Bacillus horti]